MARRSPRWPSPGTSNTDVTTVLIGASKPEQILDNIKAIENTSFSAEELQAIDAISFAPGVQGLIR